MPYMLQSGVPGNRCRTSQERLANANIAVAAAASMQHGSALQCTQLLPAAAGWLSKCPVTWQQLLTHTWIRLQPCVDVTTRRAEEGPHLFGTSIASLTSARHVTQHHMSGLLRAPSKQAHRYRSLASFLTAQQLPSSRALATAVAAKHASDVPMPTAHGSQTPNPADSAPVVSPSAPSASHPPHVTVSSEQLQDWVRCPTRAQWSHFCSILLQQVPARVQHLDYELNTILRDLTTASGLKQTSITQPAAAFQGAGRIVGVHHARAEGDMVKHVDDDADSKSNDSSNGKATTEELVAKLRTKLDEACWRLHSEVHAFLRHSHHHHHRGEHHPQHAQHMSSVTPATARSSNGGAQEVGEEQQLSIAEATDDLKKDIELESEWMIGAMRSLAESPGWWEAPQRVAALNSIMNTHQTFVLSMRVLLSEALCCWARLRRANGLKGMGFRIGPDPGGRLIDPRWSMAGPQHPPGWDEDAAQREPPSLIHTRAPLVQLLQLATEDARALCIEKNGIAPEVVVSGDDDLTVTCIDSYVEHIYLELLKNALQALVNKWGAWNVDEAEPVTVQVEALSELDYVSRLSQPNWLPPMPAVQASAVHENQSAGAAGTANDGAVCISIEEEGTGMSSSQLERAMNWFSTTHNVTRGITGYGYSRDHGSQMQGMGAGMPLCVVYARFMGGHVMWHSEKGKGTKVQLFLPRTGFFKF